VLVLAVLFRHDPVNMVPVWMPQPMAVIFVTGLLELAGAAGILPRRIAGIVLCL
jgi:uncharacterized membrane protein